MLSNFFKAILLTFLVPLATTSYAQESLDEMEDAPKEFSNFQQEVFDNLGLIFEKNSNELSACLLYTSPSPRDRSLSRMPSSA